MAKIAPQTLGAEYKAVLGTKPDGHQENGTVDCAVVAVAVVTGVDYDTAFKALEAAGRVENKPTPRELTKKAIEALGFKINELSYLQRQEVIANYPGVHKGLKNLTSHHPVRFGKVWKDMGLTNCLLFSMGHVAALKDGEVQDWSKGRALRVIGVWVIEKDAPEVEEAPEAPAPAPEAGPKALTIAEGLIEFAKANYDKGGWDFVVETMTLAEVEEMTKNCKSVDGAIRKLKPIVAALDEQRRSAMNA